jgi:hypothetical protein
MGSVLAHCVGGWGTLSPRNIYPSVSRFLHYISLLLYFVMYSLGSLKLVA